MDISSIQTVRDRLIANQAEFELLEIKDGVSLYRNPVQTMDKLKSLIPGLRNEDALDKFWEGSIVDTKHGMMPVYLPNLMDSTTRLLDKPLMNRIIREALPDLPEDTKRVIVYYIDITDKAEIEQFIKEQNTLTTIEIELRDLKQVLDNVVVEDEAEWEVCETHDTLLGGWKVAIKSFHSDRVLRKIQEVNQKGEQQALHKGAKFNPLKISDEGLETIEWLSLDCTNADPKAPWHSDEEIKIDRNGFVVRNGIKTQDFWDATIASETQPLRLKIRNICGDETVYVL
jgi:adenine-specific DNA-methyltransferase